MQVITRLVIQKKDKERVNVYLDGEFAFGLALTQAMYLKIGQELSEADIAALRDEDGYHRAHAASLNLLSRRPRSTVELRRYLQEKETAEMHIERILTRLTETGLLDDLSFARFWIENREAFRPRGAQAIRYELRQKGVAAPVIDQALGDVEFDEEDNAYRAALKLVPRLRSLEWQAFQQKLAAPLARRGFRWEVISKVARRLWDEKDSTDFY